jgi:hypothetical protein
MSEVPEPFLHKHEKIKNPLNRQIDRIVNYSTAVYSGPKDWVMQVLQAIPEDKELTEDDKSLLDNVCSSFNADADVVQVLITEKDHETLKVILDEKINTRYTNPAVYAESIKMMGEALTVYFQTHGVDPVAYDDSIRMQRGHFGVYLQGIVYAKMCKIQRV